MRTCLICITVLDVNRTPRSPPLDALHLDLLCPILHHPPLHHHVRATTPPNLRIRHPRLKPHRKSPTNETRRRIHGHLPHHVHLPLPPPSRRPHGLCQPPYAQRRLLLRCGRLNDPLRFLRRPPLHPYAAKRGPRARSKRKLGQRLQEIRQQREEQIPDSSISGG